MNYHLYLSRKKLNAQGQAPVYAKINIDGKLYERSTGVFVDPQNWSNTYKRVLPTVAGALIANETLNLFETKLTALLPLENINISKVDNHLHNALKNVNNVTIIDVVKEYLKRKENLINKPDGIVEDTYKSNFFKLKNIQNYLQSINRPLLEVSSFNYAVAENFKTYLFDQNFGIGHVNKHLVFMRSVVKFAQFEYGVPLTNFMLLKIKEPAAKELIYLTESELLEIQNHDYKSNFHRKTADIFTLQCYTGMAYCDVIKLNNESISNFEGNLFINYNRQKTGVNGLIPLLPVVKNILDKYNGKAPTMTNQCYNRILKELAAVCNINKNLTTHVGRKTFGCLLVSKGASMETTTKMLAKTNVKETAKLYATVQWQRVLQEMPKFAQ